jgi:hypothetical protein
MLSILNAALPRTRPLDRCSGQVTTTTSWRTLPAPTQAVSNQKGVPCPAVLT